MAKRSLLVYRKDRWQHENGMFRNPPTDGSKIGRNSFGTVYRQTLVAPRIPRYFVKFRAKFSRFVLAEGCPYSLGGKLGDIADAADSK